MTKKSTPNAIDSEGNLVTLTNEEVDLQTEFLESLPKDEQIKMAAAAAGMTVMEMLMQIALLHQTAEDADQGRFYRGIPCADPIIFEYIEK